MAVPTLITDLSTTAASNSPASGDNVFPDLDDFLRFYGAAIASIAANSGNGWTSPYTAISNLADTSDTAKGDALVGVKSTLTGAVARTQHGKNGDFVTLFDFMSAADVASWQSTSGTVDVTAELQAAIDALPAAGGTIYIPAGGGRISATIELDKPIALIGAGRENTENSRLLKTSAVSGPAILITSANCSIENMAFTGQAGNSGDGIVIKQQYWSLRNINVNAMGQDGIRVGDSSTITNCNIGSMICVNSINNTRHGFYFDEVSTNCGGAAFVNCFAHLNGGDGFKFDKSQLNTLVGCVTEANTGYGLNLAAGARDIWWLGGDLEANTAGQYTKHASALRCNAQCSSVSDCIGARVSNSGNLALSTGVATTLTWDTEAFDTDAMHSTSANTSRITITTPGKYLFNAMVQFESNATGRRKVLFLLNGSTYVSAQSVNPVTGDGTSVNISTLYDMAVGDYMEVVASQNSGGSLNAEVNSHFSAIRQN